MKKSILFLIFILYPLLVFAQPSSTTVIAVSSDETTVYTTHIGFPGATVTSYKGKAIVTTSGGISAFDNLTINTNASAALQIKAGTGAQGQMLIIEPAGVLSWADTSAGGGTTLSFVAPLVDTDNTITLNALTVAEGGTGQTSFPANSLVITGTGTTDQLKTAATIPAANLGLVSLTSQVSGTLPLIYAPTIPAATYISGTLPSAGWASNIDTSAEIFAIVGDENGSGRIVGSTAPTISNLIATGNVTLPNTSLTVVTGNTGNFTTLTGFTTGSGTLPTATITNLTSSTLSIAGVNTANTLVTTNLAVGSSINAARLNILGSGTTNNFALRVADNLSADKVTILDRGNVGIGTTAPGGLLNIVSSGTNVSYIVNSNLGIGTSSPGATLQVGQIMITGTTKTAYALCITSTGTLGYCSSIVGADGTCTCTNAM